MPIGTRRRCLMKKTGPEKSRDTVPLMPSLPRAAKINLSEVLEPYSIVYIRLLFAFFLAGRCYIRLRAAVITKISGSILARDDSILASSIHNKSQLTCESQFKYKSELTLKHRHKLHLVENKYSIPCTSRGNPANSQQNACHTTWRTKQSGIKSRICCVSI
jgi:hypothetical protein